MRIEYDPAKDASNRAQHGISLAAAERLDWDAMLMQVDDAENYGEERWIGIAPKGNGLYTTVYTVRGEDIMRIVSLRRATNAEIERYERQGQPQGKIQAKQRRRRGPHSSRHKSRP
ncbi:MAG: BrnT family toxin [Steroidobacteraceae bacterium]